MSIGAPFDVRLEHGGPDGFVGVTRPRVSWKISASAPSFLAARAEVRLETQGTTHVVTLDGPDQVLVDWPFEDLGSRQTGLLAVRVGDDAHWSDWSPVLPFESTLLAQEDWVAEMITPRVGGRVDEPSPVIQREFSVDDVESARLYLTAHGVYHAELNGLGVGSDLFAPGWTNYAARLRFQTYDVTAQVRAGSNLLRITLGNGWYRGRLGWSGARARYGDRLGAFVQLEVTHLDGTKSVIASDDTWMTGTGPIRSDDIYDGASLDLRVETLCEEAARILPFDRSLLTPQTTRPLREAERRSPVSLRTTLGGVTTVDFGQNLVGWVQLRVTGVHRGQRIRVQHAEVLIDGELATEALRSAKATDEYVLDESLEPVILAPSFTFHGFRYVAISGVAIENIADIEAVVVGSDLRRTGWLETDHAGINKLHENIVWSARGNLFDVPIDCPQRDERLGWGGDLQVFAPAATYLFDVAAMLDGWLADLRTEQRSDGGVPSIVPNVLRGLIAEATSDTAGFSDAAVIVPAVAYERYGDLRLLREQFDSARAWVDRALHLSGDDGIWSGGFQWGDWLDPTAPASDPSAGATDPDLMATASLARVARVLAALARALGKSEAAHYEAESERVARAFRDRFTSRDGRVVSDSVSAYAFALAWGLLEASQVAGAHSRLVDLLRRRGYRVSTGFFGTPAVLDALDLCDDSARAHRLVLQERAPSWLAQVNLGATTTWERWDSLTEDGDVNTAFMTSFNHYALGAVADWMHRTIGGIAPAAPGYRRARIAPHFGQGIGWAKARHETPYGLISTEWSRVEASVTLDITIPVGVTADLDVPGVQRTLGHGVHRVVIDASLADQPIASIGAMVDDPRLSEALSELLVSVGAVNDVDEVPSRVAPYFDLPPSDLSLHVSAPGFSAGGTFVRNVVDAGLVALMKGTDHDRTD